MLLAAAPSRRTQEDEIDITQLHPDHAGGLMVGDTDLVRVAAVQFPQPGVTFGFDSDPQGCGAGAQEGVCRRQGLPLYHGERPLHAMTLLPARTQLLRPTRAELGAYVAALERGWSPDNVRGLAAAQEELKRIADDADGFLGLMDNIEAKGPPVTLPDGSQVQRLPGLRRFIWDTTPGLPDAERFAGSINLRWAAGHCVLPPHVLGHAGYAVVPWKAGQGHATAALALLLDVARQHGLPFVELTTDPDNLASQRVITNNGGLLVERFVKAAAYGGTPGLRFRIDL